MLLVGRQEVHLACKKTEWWGVGVVICLERGADLHMVQLMPLPLTVCCFSEIQIGFTFLVPAHPGSPLNGCVCNVMSMWSLRRHFTNKSVTGHLTILKVTVRHTAGHYGEEYDDWNMQCRLEVAAELQQRWRRTNRRRKSIPRSSRSHREGLRHMHRVHRCGLLLEI